MEIKNSPVNSLVSPYQYTKPQDKTQSKDFANTLKTALESKDEKKLYESCQQLESVFLSKVFESMRSTVPGNSLLGKSFAMETFESMLNDEYAKEASKTGSVGLADIIYKQLSADMKASNAKEIKESGNNPNPQTVQKSE